jgi:hypothetical protein
MKLTLTSETDNGEVIIAKVKFNREQDFVRELPEGFPNRVMRYIIKIGIEANVKVDEIFLIGAKQPHFSDSAFKSLTSLSIASLVASKDERLQILEEMNKIYANENILDCCKLFHVTPTREGDTTVFDWEVFPCSEAGLLAAMGVATEYIKTLQETQQYVCKKELVISAVPAALSLKLETDNSPNAPVHDIQRVIEKANEAVFGVSFKI